MDPSFARVPFVGRASVVAAGRTRQATICNLSAAGLYLQMDIGQMETAAEGGLSLRFHLPDGGPLVEAEATVTWVNDTPPDSPLALPVGCGARFDALTADDAERIRRLVDRFRLQPEPMVGVSQPRSGYVRIPLIAPCTLVGPFGFAKGSTCNLSVLGVYVAAERIPDVGDTVHVELTLPGRPGSFECAGTITWQNLDRPDRLHALPPGCGVRLRNLSPDQVAFLTGLVDQYLASLPLLG